MTQFTTISTSIIGSPYDLVVNTKNFVFAPIKQLGTSSYTFPWCLAFSRFSPVWGSMRSSSYHRDFWRKNILKNGDPAQVSVHDAAALLHDLGQGLLAYFEHLFDADHEAVPRKSSILRQRFTSPATSGTRLSKRWLASWPYLSNKLGRATLSQIDGAAWTISCATLFYRSILWGIWPDSHPRSFVLSNGIAFQHNGMHAIRLRAQSLSEILGCSRSNLPWKFFYRCPQTLGTPEDKDFLHRLLHISSFLWKNVTLSDYLALDDGVMNAYFPAGWPVWNRFSGACHNLCPTTRSLNPSPFLRRPDQLATMS